MNPQQREILHTEFRKLGYTTNTQTSELLDVILRLLPVAATPAEIDVLAERMRQIADENHSTQEDDRNGHSGLRAAAAAYLIARGSDQTKRPDFWPWPARWFKPKDVRRNMVRAAALTLAAIEVYDRTKAKIERQLEETK